jgi:carbamoylphosphate synthase small subunit
VANGLVKGEDTHELKFGGRGTNHHNSELVSKRYSTIMTLRVTVPR